MKTLKKLSINPEKVIKNEELVNLRGGYGGGENCFWCTVYFDYGTIVSGWACDCGDRQSCQSAVYDLHAPSAYGVSCTG